MLVVASCLGLQTSVYGSPCTGRYVKESKVLVKVASYADAASAADVGAHPVNNGSGHEQEGARALAPARQHAACRNS